MDAGAELFELHAAVDEDDIHYKSGNLLTKLIQPIIILCVLID